MSNGFSNVRTTASDAKVKLMLVQELAYFVGQGLEKFGLPASPHRWAGVTNAIKASLAESLLQGHAERMPDKALRERVLIAYLSELDANSQRYLKEVVVPVAVTQWEEEASLILQRYGTTVAYTTVEPSLEGALAMAWLNLRRAQQRWLTWLCLGSMLRNTPEGHERESVACRDFDAVAKALQQEIRLMEKRVFMFSLLKGGDAAEKTRTWLLKTTLCEGMSVMEYLEYDGQMPSSWATAQEQALRASLRG